MKKILFVCHGNICRSVMAEFIMKYLLKLNHREDEFLIESAAASSEEIGNPIYPAARMQLSRCGIPMENHTARKITGQDYQYYDYIIAMDHHNLKEIQEIIGEDSDHKVSLLLEHTTSTRDIADPWYTNNFDTAYRDIRYGCESLLYELSIEN